MSFALPPADSPIGPALCAVGIFALGIGIVVHGVFRHPTILRPRPEAETQPPSFFDRLSMHLIIYAVWAIGFGAVVWRGVPPGMIDVRLGFERRWPVIESAEWIYLSVYLVPFLVPWMKVSRATLRRYALDLWWLLGISIVCFLLLPLGAPPRAFEPITLAGRILAWETDRADFAAASLPSFHVFWGLLVASLLTMRGGAIKWIGWIWAVAVAASCVANGAHALVDVGASFVIYAALVAVVAARRPIERPMSSPTISPTASAIAPK